MIKTDFPIGPEKDGLKLPDGTDILRMPHPPRLDDYASAVRQSLAEPVASERLEQIIRSKTAGGKSVNELSACIVISDSTRPVPYKGEQGILWPLADILLKEGVEPENILVLVATGTHRAQTEEELRDMLDTRIFENGIRVANHDCTNEQALVNLGTTSKGGNIIINRDYMESDIRILTGLVESHFMAGASGGRKSICPGLIGEESTFVFHGAPMLAHENSRALLLDGNPCHEESKEMALKAGADFICNVTLDGDFNLTGVFSGDLIKAHEAAVEHLKSYTAIPVDKKYDIVVSHGGFVGINHYQVAKAGVEASRIVRENGYVLIGGDNTDTDPVGSIYYRTALQLLKIQGTENFEKILTSPDWAFILEQWQVQMWTKLFKLIPQDHFYYFAPQFSDGEYMVCAGEDMRKLSGSDSASIPEQISLALENLIEKVKLETGREEVSVCWMADGPYGVPLYEN